MANRSHWFLTIVLLGIITVEQVAGNDHTLFPLRKFVKSAERNRRLTELHLKVLKLDQSLCSFMYRGTVSGLETSLRYTEASIFLAADHGILCLDTISVLILTFHLLNYLGTKDHDHSTGLKTR